MPNQSLAVTKRGQLRTFLQLGGAGANNPEKFMGVDGAYVEVTGINRPILGGVDPVNIWDPRSSRGFIQANKMIKPPALPSAKIDFSEVPSGLPLPWFLGQCPLNMYEIIGNCTDLSDFLLGWSGGGYIRVYSNGVVIKADPGDGTAMEADTPVKYSVEATFDDIYSVGALGFGQAGISLTSQQVVDVVFGSKRLCADCGIPDDGTRLAFAALNPGGSYTQPQVGYSLDGGATWTKATISTAAVGENVAGIDIVGNYVVVLSKTAGGAGNGGYYYASLGTTGVPGSFTKVTAGFVNTFAPNDILVNSSTEIWFVADGGYIYKSVDITAGVTVNNAAGATSSNLLRIDGNKSRIVATGASSAIISTNNGGKTWGAPTVVPVVGATNVQAVMVMGNPLRWWIGTNFGQIFYTQDGGESWAEKKFSGSGVGEITDIVSADPEIIYFTSQTATPTGRIFSSYDGGYTFTSSAPRILNLPSIYKINRLAVPYVPLSSVSANNLLVGGLATSLNGGLYQGTASVF